MTTTFDPNCPNCESGVITLFNGLSPCDCNGFDDVSPFNPQAEQAELVSYIRQYDSMHAPEAREIVERVHAKEGDLGIRDRLNKWRACLKTREGSK